MCVCNSSCWGGGASLQQWQLIPRLGAPVIHPWGGRRGSGVERSVARQRRNAPHSAFLTALRQAFEGYQQTAGAGAPHPTESRSQWVPVSQNSSFKESRSELFPPDRYKHSLSARPFIESWVFIYWHWGTKIIQQFFRPFFILFRWIFIFNELHYSFYFYINSHNKYPLHFLCPDVFVWHQYNPINTHKNVFF